ncbi:hypothetical protein ACQ4PT_052453 [Festuca glaucescens]
MNSVGQRWGGKDAASARYIYTRLSPVARLIFPKDDDVLLNYLNEDGQSIEPSWFVPIIPMVLVNGSEGIGTGWSSNVPNYNPRDIIANLKRLLKNEALEPMDPWYKGFKGSIEKTIKATGVTYTITGIIEAVNDSKLNITELPIRRWTDCYKDFLELMCADSDKEKEKEKGKDKNKDKNKNKKKVKEKDKEKEPPFLETVRSYSDDVNVDFEVTLSEENMNIAKEEGLVKKFKLTSALGITNMHLFGPDGKIRKYETPEEKFFTLRLEYNVKRKDALFRNITLEMKKLDEKVRFILAVVKGEIKVNNRKRAELVQELKQKGYESFPKNKKKDEPVAAGATDDVEGDEESTADAADASGYDYLLSMSIGTLTLEKVQQLLAQQENLRKEVVRLSQTEPTELWFKDLEALEKELDRLDTIFEKAQEKRRDARENNMKKKEAESKAAPKRQPKKTAVKSEKAGSDDEDYGAPMPKPAAQKKKPAKKASAPVKEEEEEMLELKDRLVAYSINDSSPELSAMDTETTEGQQKGKKGRNAPTKRGAAKKAMASLIELSNEDIAVPTDESEDEEFAMTTEAPVEKKARGRKLAAEKPAAEKPKTTAARKRAPAPSKGMRQKVLEETFKPVDDSNSNAPSPEKKVRKIRASPFNKKSSSILQRASTSTEDADAPPSGSSAEPVAPRRTVRERKTTLTYVESENEDKDSDDEDVLDVSDDSEYSDDD